MHSAWPSALVGFMLLMPGEEPRICAPLGVFRRKVELVSLHALLGHGLGRFRISDSNSST